MEVNLKKGFEMPSIWKNQTEQDKVQDHEDAITKLAEAIDWNKIRCFMMFKDQETGELKATLRYCYLDVDTHLELPVGEWLSNR